MSAIERVETNRGIELRIPKKTVTTKEKWVGIIFLFIFLGIPVVWGPLFILTKNYLISTILVVPIYLGLYYTIEQIVNKFKSNEKFIVVDPKGKRFTDSNQNWVFCNLESEIVLKREYSTKTVTNSDNRSNTTYILNWIIIKREGEFELPVYSFTQSTGDLDFLLRVQGSGYMALAEEIAELLGLPLIDATGDKEIRRVSGDTDTPLVEILKRGNIEKFAGIVDPRVGDEFEIKNENQGYIIIDRDFNARSDLLLLVVLLGIIDVFLILGLLSILIDDQMEFIDKLILAGMMLLFLGIFLPVTNLFGNRARSKNILKISPTSIKYVKKGLFSTLVDQELKLIELEKIVKFNIGGEMGLELVSDRVRIPIYGKFDVMELEMLEKLLNQILVSV